MAQPTRPFGTIRDAILDYFDAKDDHTATIAEVRAALQMRLGDVAPSSVRAYLQTRSRFERVAKGVYKLRPGRGRVATLK